MDIATSRKIKIISYAVAAVALIALVVVLVSGSHEKMSWNWFGYTSEKLDGQVQPYRESGSYEVDPADIDAIKINWVGGRVTAEMVDDAMISFVENDGNSIPEKNALRYSKDNRTLHIVEGERKFRFFSSWGADQKKSLTIFIPSTMSTQLNSIHIETVSGNLTVSNLIVSEMHLETVSGLLEGNNLKADKLGVETVSGSVRLLSVESPRVKMEAVTGSVHIAGTIHDLSVDSVSGSVDATLTEKAKVNIDTVSGNVTLTVPGVSDSSFSFDTVSGKKYSDVAILESGIADYSVDTVTGNLTIREFEP